MKNKIIIIGSGGHALSCIEIIENNSDYKIIGIIDNEKKIGSLVFGYKIIGNDNDLKEIYNECKNAFIGIGQIKTHKVRLKIYDNLKKIGYQLPTIIAKNSYVSKRSEIGEGSIIMNNVFINANCKIGNNCIINNNALIEHECQIFDNCHISTNVTLNGNVKINDNCFIGSCSVFKNGYELKTNQIIPFGSRIK